MFVSSGGLPHTRHQGTSRANVDLPLKFYSGIVISKERYVVKHPCKNAFKIPELDRNQDDMMTSSNGNISALPAICAGNSPVTGEFPAQRPVTRSFDVFFDPRLNKRLSKQSWGWWFETPSRPLWRHRNCPVYGAFDLGLAVSVPLPIVTGIFVLLWFQSRLT